MIPDASNAISWLAANPQILKGIRRGIERESLRINANGNLAQTLHPKSLGSALTHKWITTDFAEALLEFITPIDVNINHILTSLRDIHRYVLRHLENERLWPMSMPCFIENIQTIRMAQYGSSNIGRMKTVYRKGLKNRYSALMQVIAGVHYNFSLPLTFWKSYTGINSECSEKKIISAGYLQLIRNYYRFGWVIPYLFGASPGTYPSFLKRRVINLPFKYAPSNLIYLPYATSLRLSELGYSNKLQNKLGITFNSLDEYVYKLKKAIKTPSPDYQRIGLQRNGHYVQLNTNVLQIENELYVPIRPKRVVQRSESLSDALMRDGIEYVEVRSLDINPFSPIGIDEEQVRFLDLFLIWCALTEAPKMSSEELICTYKNWNRVLLEGRKPGLMIYINCNNTVEQPLNILGKTLFSYLRCVAEILDSNNGNTYYQQVCDRLVSSFDYPEITLSARFLDKLIKHGTSDTGLILAEEYYQILRSEPLEILKEVELDNERVHSLKQQHALEAADHLNFDEFLANHNQLG